MKLITESELNQFIGTEHIYKHLTGFVFTDGVKFVGDAGAYWLIDEIMFHMKGSKKVKKLPELLRIAEQPPLSSMPALTIRVSAEMLIGVSLHR